MVRLTQANFDQFLKNQEKFAESLNHRMSTIETNSEVMKNDVSWIKKLLGIGITLLTGIFLAILNYVFKIIVI